MRYEVDSETFYDIEDVLNYCIEDDYHEDDDEFEDWVNDEYGSITICGDEYYAYDILEKADDHNWSYAKSRYCEEKNDNDREDAIYELTHCKANDYVYIQSYTVYVYDNDISKDEAEDAVEIARQNIENKRKISEEEKQDEDKFMSLFQTLGG